MERGHGREGDWPAAPEALPGRVVDTHTHLDLAGVAPDEALAKAAAVGVARVVQIGVDLPSSQWGVELAQQRAREGRGDVLAAVALHPNEAPLLAEKGQLSEALAGIERLAAEPGVHGVGETGLDFFRTGEGGREAQEESFRAHIEIAKRYGRALMIHDREAHDDVLRVLDQQGAPEVVIFHCFSGDVEFARRCAERAYFMSFAGNVTFKNAASLREAAASAPAETLLVETDGPFLTPMPHRGAPNGPYLMPHTVRLLAELRGERLETLCELLWSNAQRALRLAPELP